MAWKSECHYILRCRYYDATFLAVLRVTHTHARSDVSCNNCACAQVCVRTQGCVQLFNLFSRGFCRLIYVYGGREREMEFGDRLTRSRSFAILGNLFALSSRRNFTRCSLNSIKEFLSWLWIPTNDSLVLISGLSHETEDCREISGNLLWELDWLI